VQNGLNSLDPIQNHPLRLCLGAYRTSPSSSLSVLAYEPPLSSVERKCLCNTVYSYPPLLKIQLLVQSLLANSNLPLIVSQTRSPVRHSSATGSACMRSNLTKKTPCRVLFPPLHPGFLVVRVSTLTYTASTRRILLQKYLEVDFTSCALIMMVFIQYTLTVQRTVIEWRRLLLPERNSAKTVRLPYHTKQTF